MATATSTGGNWSMRFGGGLVMGSPADGDDVVIAAGHTC